MFKQKNMSAKKSTSRDPKADFINKFMEFVLENGKLPATVYKFCKETKTEEKDFYAHFGSIKGIQAAIWDSFYEHTIDLLAKNKEYASYGNKEKLLSFFYTFFELLTLNRSYVLFSLDNGRINDRMEQLKGLRKRIKSFASDLIQEANDEKSRIGQRSPAIFSEGAWWHFLFILKFWADDNSAGFEKTDVAIEKSINTIFDLFDNTPLESIVDFGKFLYQEKMA